MPRIHTYRKHAAESLSGSAFQRGVWFVPNR
jgi:hypothetical protein